jgi:hypothetical protein
MSNNFDLDDEAIIEALTDLFYGYYETENIQDSIEAVLSDCSINEDTTVEDSLYILDSNLIPATVGLFAEKWSRLTEEHDSDLNATFDTFVAFEGISEHISDKIALWLLATSTPYGFGPTVKFFKNGLGPSLKLL